MRMLLEQKLVVTTDCDCFGADVLAFVDSSTWFRWEYPDSKVMYVVSFGTAVEVARCCLVIPYYFNFTLNLRTVEAYPRHILSFCFSFMSLDRFNVQLMDEWQYDPTSVDHSWFGANANTAIGSWEECFRMWSGHGLILKGGVFLFRYVEKREDYHEKLPVLPNFPCTRMIFVFSYLDDNLNSLSLNLKTHTPLAPLAPSASNTDPSLFCLRLQHTNK